MWLSPNGRYFQSLIRCRVYFHLKIGISDANELDLYELSAVMVQRAGLEVSIAT